MTVKMQHRNILGNIAIAFLGIVALYLWLNLVRMNENGVGRTTEWSLVEGFSTIFLSIILEAIPFIIIGAFVSTIIQIFVSPEFISRIIPKKRFIGLLAASLLGLVFPVCECAIVPIMRRLIKKGVPVHIAVTFMVAVPIVNPVVLASTAYAFPGASHMVLLRGFLGMGAAILIGHIVGVLQGGNDPMRANHDHNACGCGHSHHHDEVCCDEHEHGHEHEHSHQHRENAGILGKIAEVIEHTSMELYDVGKFLIFGSFLAALMQTFISRRFILSIGQNSISSVVVMMLLAFVLSLCSEADAFVARTFLGQFTNGSIVGFLIYGPMIDIKNTIMLSGSFKVSFVVRLILVITVICFAAAMMVNFIGL